MALIVYSISKNAKLDAETALLSHNLFTTVPGPIQLENHLYPENITNMDPLQTL